MPHCTALVDADPFKYINTHMPKAVRDITSLCIDLSLKTNQLLPPILSHFWGKKLFSCFSLITLG